MNERRLCSLSSGLTPTDSDNVNCNRTEQVGEKIQPQFDNVSVVEAAIKRSDQV